MLSKSVLPEKMCCIAVDRRGRFAATGTVNGRVYLWEVGRNDPKTILTFV